jgi:signal peptidase II
MRRLQILGFLLALVVCVGCDHASKQLAGSLLSDSSGLSLARGAIRFELVSNPGGFLSFGTALPETLRLLLFIGLVPVLLAWLCMHFLRSPETSPGQVAALALLAGGGLGNWLDRVLHGGAVTDFVSLGLGPLRTGIFNLADLGIVAGIVLLLRPARRA